MAEEAQQTVQAPARLEGRGLFTGESARVSIRPAPVDHGISFVRTDTLDNGQPARIPGLITSIAARPRRTTLQVGSVAIETCEHCLSALAGLGVDNAVVEVEGPEMPAGDGSAKPYVEARQQAGLTEQDEPRRTVKITDPITVEDGEAMIAALPTDSDDTQLIYDLDYGADSPIHKQLYAFSLRNGHYAEQIAPARTFVLESEARQLQAQGMGKHLGPKDVLVIGKDGPIGGNEFRFEDELVRHKLVDLIGDLSLLGCRIQGRIMAYRSSHRLNHRLTEKLHQVVKAKRRDALISADGLINIRQIQRLLPHRYPMLLIDRVVEIEGEQRAVGIKNVTINEPFFGGHYPGTPIMPGVLIVEAMAQLSGVLLSRKLEHTGKLAVLLSMDNVKLRKPVMPGDQLVIEAETIHVRSRTGHTRCRAYVGPNIAAEAQIKFMLVDAEPE